MKVSLEPLLDTVRSFAAREQGIATEAIEPDTQLLQEGYLDSFAVVRLIAEIEQRFGLSLPAGALIPEDFVSVTTLHQRLTEL